MGFFRLCNRSQIKKGIQDCCRDKSLGPDGYSLVVYQDCWDILKQDLLDVFEDFYNSGVVNSVTNSTYVCLILEKDEHMRLSEFRPISLETSLYKIIAKVLSLRLRGCKGRLFLLLTVLL